MSRTAMVLVLVVMIAACDLELSVDPMTAPTAPTTSTTVPSSSTTAAPVTTLIPPPDLTELAARWTVSLRRAGPYLVGMTLAEAEAAAPARLIELEDGDPACSFWIHDPATGIGDEMMLMVRAGRIARIDVDGTSLRTLSGIGVGDTASAVTSTYGGLIVSSRPPDGQVAEGYLTYIPDDAVDIEYRIRFEIVGGVVTTFRIGTVPEVEWVNRCGR
ncbi:MAG: hypothetical protein OEO77_04975 [Acidimicrobiia bacterium]|nr:hypothetical protein [Acidimicrobiia bacterium]